MAHTEVINMLISCALLIILTLASGAWLHKAGTPYRPGPFNFHKLLALGFVVLTAISYTKGWKLSGTTALHGGLLALAILAVLALFASGGILSRNKMERFMRRIHRAGTAALLLSLAGFLYLMMK